MRMESFPHEPRGVTRRQLCRLGESEHQVPIPRPLGRVGLDLFDERRHQIERDRHVGELVEQRDHPPVVLERMEPDPRQNRLTRHRVEVVGLVHVPHDGKTNGGRSRDHGPVQSY